MSMTFIIVGPHDNPVFEMDVVGARSAAAEPKVTFVFSLTVWEHSLSLAGRPQAL